jgi:hypothetical protein
LEKDTQIREGGSMKTVILGIIATGWMVSAVALVNYYMLLEHGGDLAPPLTTGLFAGLFGVMVSLLKAKN